MWTKGRTANAAALKAAAAAILVRDPNTAPTGITILEAEDASSTIATDKVNISLAILTGYIRLNDPEKALPVGRQIAEQHPESVRAFQDYAFTLSALRRFQEAEEVAQGRLQRIPGNIEAERALAQIAVDHLDYSTGRSRLQKLVDEGKAEPQDLNGIAWHSLFTGKVESSDLEAVLKGAELSDNTANILHTLGCVYAELGKTKEAREVLAQAMDKLNLDEPDDNYWYAFGRIAEQYGERDVALADYGRVTKPKRELEIPDSSYRLAQIRTAVLNAQGSSRPTQK